MNRWFHALVITAIVVSGSSALFAQKTIFVRNNGNDANDGLTEADALATELVDEADEHDSVENGNAGEGDETDSGRNRERHAAHPEGKDSASDRKRHTNEDECRLSQRAEAQE